MHKVLKQICAVALGIIMMFSIPFAVATNTSTERVPVRAFFEALDGDVEWDGSLLQITIGLGADEVRFYIGGRNAYVNGNPVRLGQAVELDYGTSLISANDLSRVLSAIRTAAVDAHGSIAFGHLEFIEENLGFRFPFSVRERETAEWIVEELINMGHDPENIYVQEFPINPLMYAILTDLNLIGDGEPVPYIPEFWRGQLALYNIHDMSAFDGAEFLMYSQNVILTVPGVSDRRIIVGAHYDGVNNVGISDNASGIVTLLESAQRILDLEHYYTVTYIFFGAEEIGLVGAFYYVNSLTEAEINNIALMVNVDVIFDGSTLTFGAGYFNAETGQEGCNEVSRLIEGLAVALNEEFNMQLVREQSGIFVSSDSMAFLDIGVNILAFYSMDGFTAFPLNMMALESLITVETMQLLIYALDGNNDPAIRVAIEANRVLLEFIAIDVANSSDVMDTLRETLEFVELMAAAMDVSVEMLDPYGMLGLTRAILTIYDHAALGAFVAGSSLIDILPGGTMGYVLHTDNDNLAYITETWPGLIERALEAYLLLLERVLTLPAGSLG